jgi:Tfp pilus assembly protein PilF
MQIQAQTIANTLVEDANRLTENTAYFIGLDNMEWRRLVREAIKLRNIDPHAGWAVLGMLYGIVGDVDQMNQAFRSSIDLRNNPTTIVNWIGNLVSVGQFSAAQELFAKEGHPTKASFTYLYEAGLMSFSYQKADEYFELAKEMNMNLDALNKSSFARTLASFLRERDISDAHLAKHFDAAGKIMRKHGIVVTHETSMAQIDGIHHGITVALDVPVSQEEAFDMNIELAMAEDEFGIEKHPAFDIVFSAK